jgi:exonuclease III
VLGDCNVTLALGSLDTTREFSGGEYSAGRHRFLSLVDDCKLRDEWRARNPDARRFTSFQQRGGDGGPRQARVDLALVPQRLASAVRRVEILDADGTFTSGNYEKALRSDHVPILLEMSV